MKEIYRMNFERRHLSALITKTRIVFYFSFVFYQFASGSVFSGQAGVACRAVQEQNLQKLFFEVANTNPTTISANDESLINGGSHSVFLDPEGNELPASEFAVDVGNTVISDGQTTIIDPTGNRLQLSAGAIVSVAQVLYDKEDTVCHVGYLIENGRAEITTGRKAENCTPPNDERKIYTALWSPTEIDCEENCEASAMALIEPIGTHYSVDVNREVSYLNGEQEIDNPTNSNSRETNIAVHEGAVQVFIRRASAEPTVGSKKNLKKSKVKKTASKKQEKSKRRLAQVQGKKKKLAQLKKKKNTSKLAQLKFKKGKKQKQVATYDVEDFETEPITLKRYGKVKIKKKGEKERIAEIEVIKPSDE